MDLDPGRWTYPEEGEEIWKKERHLKRSPFKRRDPKGKTEPCWSVTSLDSGCLQKTPSHQGALPPTEKRAGAWHTKSHDLSVRCDGASGRRKIRSNFYCQKKSPSTSTRSKLWRTSVTLALTPAELGPQELHTGLLQPSMHPSGKYRTWQSELRIQEAEVCWKYRR